MVAISCTEVGSTTICQSLLREGGGQVCSGLNSPIHRIVSLQIGTLLMKILYANTRSQELRD